MSEVKPSVGCIGIGLMGLPISLRLIEHAFRVTVYDTAADKMTTPVAQGAAEATSAAALTATSDVVLVCVHTTGAVREAVFGSGGVAEAASEDKVLVDLSTTIVGETREMAEKLGTKTGMPWVDAPMSGGPPAAELGELTLMLGGDEAAIARARPAIDCLAGQAAHMGPVGAGQVAKMVNQVIVLTNYFVLAEALKLAENAGIDAAKLPECLSGGYADSALLQRVFPRMVARQYEPPAGYLRQALKDLDMVHDLAKASQVATPMSSLAASLFRLMQARGHGESDGISVLKLYDEEIAAP